MRKLYFSNIVAFLFLFATSVFAQSEHHSATSATADSTVAVHGVESTAEHAAGAEAHEEGKVDLGHMIMHHIADDHKWEFAHGVGVHLPVIAYTKDGVKVFSSSKLEDEHGNPVAYEGLILEHGKLHAEDGSHVLDLSITKNVASLLVSAVLLLLIFINFGFIITAYFIIAALIGAILLETVNYIEHYGLQREKGAGALFERVQPHHSWNSNHIIGRLMLFELSRHSDHHYLASRKYQILRSFDNAPQMPTGYPGMILLSLVPPLWFKVMNNRMKKYNLK